jgi:hypothetical protein
MSGYDITVENTEVEIKNLEILIHSKENELKTLKYSLEVLRTLVSVNTNNDTLPVEDKTEVKTEIKPVVEVKNKAEIKPAVEVENKVEVKVETEVKPEAEFEIEPVVEEKTDVKPAVEVETKAEDWVEVKAKTKTPVKTKACDDIDAEFEIEPEVKDKVEIKPVVEDSTYSKVAALYGAHNGESSVVPATFERLVFRTRTPPGSPAKRKPGDIAFTINTKLDGTNMRPFLAEVGNSVGKSYDDKLSVTGSFVAIKTDNENIYVLAKKTDDSYKTDINDDIGWYAGVNGEIIEAVDCAVESIRDNRKHELIVLYVEKNPDGSRHKYNTTVSVYQRLYKNHYSSRY